MTLRELIDHCGNVAEKELLQTGECTSTFAAVDPMGKVTLFTLPPVELAFLAGMLRTYCGAFRTEQYAVTSIMLERPKHKNSKERETLTVLASSTTEKMFWTRDILRSKGSLKLGIPGISPVEGGYLSSLLPQKTLMSRDRQLMHAMWGAVYQPLFHPICNQSENN